MLLVNSLRSLISASNCCDDEQKTMGGSDLVFSWETVNFNLPSNVPRILELDNSPLRKLNMGCITRPPR